MITHSRTYQHELQKGGVRKFLISWVSVWLIEKVLNLTSCCVVLCFSSLSSIFTKLSLSLFSSYLSTSKTNFCLLNLCAVHLSFLSPFFFSFEKFVIVSDPIYSVDSKEIFLHTNYSQFTSPSVHTNVSQKGRFCV
mmetsp:Transcript_32632/g.44811  ORF Transcript_32632/g.44811 Transcript_32632/m.44811 type:complete len:136 (+) Transcript_32632:1687-2094(+)